MLLIIPVNAIVISIHGGVVCPKGTDHLIVRISGPKELILLVAIVPDGVVVIEILNGPPIGSEIYIWNQFVAVSQD